VLAHDEHLSQIINRKFGTELQARMTQLHEAAAQAEEPGEPQPPSRTEQATKARDKLEPSEL
jgi:hypothetical protein